MALSLLPLCHVLQSTCCYFCPPGILLPIKISPYFSRESYGSALYQLMRATNLRRQPRPFPRPAEGPPCTLHGFAALADFGNHILWPAGLGPLIQGQFFPCASPLLFCCMFSCCFYFSIDAWQKKNNSAPHRHFNNSYSTSVPAILINKCLLEYNNFLLEQAVFKEWNNNNCL